MKHLVKTIMSMAIIVFAMLVIVACSFTQSPENNLESRLSNPDLEPYPYSITLEEISERATGYYPDHVSFQFICIGKISDEVNQQGFVNQQCYIFDVIHEGKKVSGVAVGVDDGSIWIYDMVYGSLWLSEGFMGLTNSGKANVLLTEPVIELTNQSNDGNKSFFYFARLNTIPELSTNNEGSITWNENEKTLTLSAIKGTGSVTGALDGPYIGAVFTWKKGKPELINVEYEPAPTFSHPSQILLSGEIMNIEEGRLLEIAEYFKSIVDEKTLSLP